MGSCSSKPAVSRSLAKGKQQDRTNRGLSGAVSTTNQATTNQAEEIEMGPIYRNQGEQSNPNQSDTLSPPGQPNRTEPGPTVHSPYSSMTGGPLQMNPNFFSPFQGSQCHVRLQTCPSNALIDKQCQNFVWNGRWCQYHYKMLQMYVTQRVLDDRMILVCADWFDHGVLALSILQPYTRTPAAPPAVVQNTNASDSGIRNAGPSGTSNGEPSGIRNGDSSGTRSGGVSRGDNGESSGIRNGESSGDKSGESFGTKNNESPGDKSGESSTDKSGESSRVGGSLDTSRLEVYTNPQLGSEERESRRGSQEGQMPPFVPVYFDEGEAS